MSRVCDYVWKISSYEEKKKKNIYFNSNRRRYTPEYSSFLK